jgi:hypothetical protein
MPVTRRRNGRPPLDPTGRSVPVCLRLPGQRYDELYVRAQTARVSVPELIRRSLKPEKIDIESSRRDA